MVVATRLETLGNWTISFINHLLTFKLIKMKSVKIIFGALAGVALGIQIGLLVAPQKGADTRKKLTKRGEEYLNDFNGQLNHLVKGFSEKFDKINKEIANVAEETKAKSNEWLGQAKSKGKDQVDKAKDQFN